MAAVFERDGEWHPVPRPVRLERVVRGAILNALAFTNGHQGEAAALLGLSPRQMSYQVRQYRIPTDTPARRRCALRLVRARQA
jgi:transcriptional regulator with GAF, ATPase, and Fis domain